MPQPFDYTLNVPNPVDQLLEGMKIGRGLRSEKEQRKVQQVAAQKQADFEAASAALGPHSTPAEFEKVMRMLPPDQQQAFLDPFLALNEEQRANTLAFASQVLSATLHTPKIAADMLRERATAERKNGNEEGAKAWDVQAKIIEVDKDGAFTAMAAMISGLPEGPDAVRAAQEAQSAIIEEKEKEAEIAKTKAETETEKVNKAYKEAQIEKLNAEVDEIESQLETAIKDNDDLPKNIKGIIAKEVLNAFFNGLKIEKIDPVTGLASFIPAPITQENADFAMAMIKKMLSDDPEAMRMTLNQLRSANVEPVQRPQSAVVNPADTIPAAQLPSSSEHRITEAEDQKGRSMYSDWDSLSPEDKIHIVELGYPTE